MNRPIVFKDKLACNFVNLFLCAKLGSDRVSFEFVVCLCNVCKSVRLPSPHLFDDDLSILVDGAVVDHAYYGHAQITPDTEGDAEAQAAHHGYDVPARQTEAAAVAQRGLLLRGLPRPSILRQLDHVPGLLPSFYHPGNSQARKTLTAESPFKNSYKMIMF